MAVAIPAVARLAGDEDPQPCLYLGTLIELFLRDQSPSRALCSLLAMCWFWPSDSEAEERDLFLGSVLLSLGRLLKNKLACVAADIDACLQIICCQEEAKGEKRPVTMG